jgi:hypothetical protein
MRVYLQNRVEVRVCSTIDGGELLMALQEADH